MHIGREKEVVVHWNGGISETAEVYTYIEAVLSRYGRINKNYQIETRKAV